MNPWLIFLLATLTCFRLSVMFSKESGPGRIFKIMRSKTPPKSALREGVSCALCESVWWSSFITAFLVGHGDVPLAYSPFYWLAVSGGAVVLNQRFTKDL